MALILHIETATTVCSVALAEDGKLLSLKEENKKNTHAENSTLFIEHVLKVTGKTLSDVDAIAVSSGPGSYTGLRIGVSTAKGLCYALEKPLIAVSTLLSLAQTFQSSKFKVKSSKLCPMIDARRMEVFCAVYNESLEEVESISAKIIDEHSFSSMLKNETIQFFGDGAEKCKPVLVHQRNAVFVDNIVPSAASMVTIAQKKFVLKQFEDVSLFEPFYLKEFMDGKKSGT